MDALWFVRNTTTFRDLEDFLITEIMKTRARKLDNHLTKHLGQLLDYNSLFANKYKNPKCPLIE